jgi:hypothetical protein
MGYILNDSSPGFSGLGWWVKTFATPEGHETLTRNAAAGLPLSSAEIGFLIDGVRRPDEASLVAHVRPSEQRRHFLRSTVLQNTPDAWRDATGHLRGLHARILAFGASRAPEQFRLMGEALHLIQDSFAPAHVERTGGTGRITRIKNFGPTTNILTDHGFPADPRDRIHTGILRPTLRPEAAGATAASRDYLAMTLRHIGGGVPPATIAAELTAFINRHLSL